MNIDLERIRKASKNIYVNGRIQHDVGGDTRNEGVGGRLKMIEEAITAIMENGEEAMKGRYFGMKQYSGFGDQRCDCEDGMGPRHGSIVFRIGRTNEGKDVKLGQEEVYLLECVRDYGDVKNPDGNRDYDTLNLLDVLSRLDNAAKKAETYAHLLVNATVESHAETPA